MDTEWNSCTNGYNNNGLYQIGKGRGSSVVSFVIIYNINYFAVDIKSNNCNNG